MSGRAERSRAEASDELLAGPIRGELLGADHLAARARAVARGQQLAVANRPLRPARLLARLAETRRILADAHARLLASADRGQDGGPAAEWLLDNFHIVQEHLLEVRASLPGGYYRELPELRSGPLTGYPRVYEMAISLISHSEARIDLHNVDTYVEAFQSVAVLSLGELWAMPAMLRLGLIESVRRMTLRTVQRLDEIDLADAWADRIRVASGYGGNDLRAALREFADAEHSLTPHFVSRFLQTIRQTEGASASLEWLEHWMREVGVSPENAVAQSTNRLALTQIMMANSITSLRDIGRRDWRVFVEHQSAMEAVLREDPSGFYPLMTFATRDTYRHVVERIAKRTARSEVSIASRAIDLARQQMTDDAMDAHAPGAFDLRRQHVGYYLLDDGLLELERATGYSPRFRERIERRARRAPDLVFANGLVLCTILATVVVMVGVGPVGRAVPWLVLLFAFLPALDIAVTVLNHLVTTSLAPRLLPRLDLHRHGVPAEYRTVVVVPTLFSSVPDVGDALENLEVQFLANREAHLHFAVLSDFTDSATEVGPHDAEIVAAALAGIRALNARHAVDAPDVFFLLHRARRWNAQQGVWMGWERKRGKLAQFNQLLRGNPADAFSVISGDTTMLQTAKYVITLDADTSLPPDAAPSLIGAMAHPLNRAVYDVERQRMVHGYGILQPRVGVSLPSAHASPFASIASGHPGVDPYSTAVSDVYQDLYGEGSFTGKGIYDVDAFQLATHGRFPENTLLSHDLIEGNYARAGLVTDVIVYDDYPSTYIGHARRKHRWIRGDWQLLPWLRRRVPGPDGLEPNRLSLVSQWKIIDNLRRSTVELSQLLFLIAGWTILPGSALRWTLLGLGAIVAPWMIALVRAMVQPPLDKSWRAYYAAVAQDAWESAQQAGVAVVFLPHQAWISVDAIVRTGYRLLVSHRLLLEWQSALLVERQVSDLKAESWRAMRTSVVGVLLLGVAVAFVQVRHQLALGLPIADLLPTGLLIASLLIPWTLAPLLAVRLSRPARTIRRPLSPEARAAALRYAQHHWAFFDRFVTADTHWLAPDNFQSDPEPVVAMRTSPTNIGLQLLATVSAHDLGLLSPGDMTDRLERTMATLASLPKYRGHLFNWYDLTDLHVLAPAYISTVDSGNLAGHLIALRQACLSLAATHATLQTRLLKVADHAYAMAVEMDFTFLYDDARKLFTIGYHPDSLTPDESFYDLLASEARLASFMAIAKNDVPVAHWFRLSRSLNRTSGAMALVSWSGSMFEYLMPLLVMRSLPFTLLDQTYHGVVDRHRAYARARAVPWGASESAYNLRDRHQTYQYRAFGIADLALKRGLGRDLVIAPYATALAALVDPSTAMENLAVLDRMGALGAFGFCDALDYTRPAPGSRFAFVRAYMAHHIGMTLVSLTNVLRNDLWQDRFHADPLVKSVELLLHERMPRRLAVHTAQTARPDEAQPAPDRDRPVVREVNTLRETAPRIALLGSRPYTVMLNHNGSGYSQYESLAVTRWRADGTRDDAGQFCYVQDLTSGRRWSTGLQPIGAAADWSRASLALDRVTLHRADGDIETRTEITVVPGDAAEVRRVTLTNSGSYAHDIELTSYGEIVLAPQGADQAHAAFSNLFVETEWHAWCSAITATRRPRTGEDVRRWCVHLVDAGPDRLADAVCETDRARFIGRGRSVHDPAALDAGAMLSGTTGAVLDPIFAIRTRVRVPPGHPVSVTFTTLVATSREAAFALAGRYHDTHAAQRALDFAWSATTIELQTLGLNTVSASLFQDLATQLLFQGGSLAPPRDEVARNRGSQPRLWAHGLSGDLPIVLATIDAIEGLPTLREVFEAHRYWRLRGLAVDLVVINAQPYDYLQELRDGIGEAMAASGDAALTDQPGGVFVRRRDIFQPDDFLMLSATARMQVPCDGRSLARILASAERRLIGPDGEAPSGERGNALATIVSALRPLVAPLVAPLGSTSTLRADRAPDARDVVDDPLRFANGIGGLTSDDDYLMTIDRSRIPPAPWVNVIANAHGGFVVSERGAGCTWAENSYFFRLTPWHNDPVSDPVGDVLYLQDTDTGALWSATPAPIESDGRWEVRHGAGSTAFVHDHDGIRSELLLGAPEDAAVKISVLRLRNDSSRRRRLTLTAFAEWTLGARRDLTQHQVQTWYAATDNAILARNTFDPSFAEWTAFLTCSEPVLSYSADRLSFLGRHGDLNDPAALRRASLDGVTGVGVDPCAALQTQLILAPGESRDVVVLLGAARSEREARRVMTRLRTPASARGAITASVRAWRDRLSVVKVHTPDAAFDAMINKWTLYQALGCRMWARTALYQSSGAYGFRDQLQDTMAFVYAEPAIAREHILRAAARQFQEGDVQHWWHPHTGRGVRTRFSDDLAWLPFVVDQYVRVTGDHSVLDDFVPFLAMRELGPDEHERYDLPSITDEHGDVYEHCRRALRRAATRGAHGLPLIGTGDWNDGMSLVGAGGKGESVWLAWFLIATLRDFAVHADRRGDATEAAWMRGESDRYRTAVEAHGWDGQWYRRAYFDDGSALGSAENDECRIDSIAQSWSVIAGAGPSARAELAMRSMATHLVREEDRLILLLTPPFDRSEHDPGYIKGYLPGVRENGAQYTHAALWAVMATAMQGDGDRAFELFQMLNPLTHAANADDMLRYKVEPYVVAADVYSAATHVGRGGWTWYTGSASWMYRVGLEHLLGFTKSGNSLVLSPCVPAEWPEYSLSYRFGATEYAISVVDPGGVQQHGATIEIDGVRQSTDVIPLVDDGQRRHVVVSPAR
jgi:cyclic beta-1,2-glucan synthetase